MFKNIFGLLVVLLISFSSHAETGSVTGTVTILRSHDVSVAGNWFQIDVANAGNCGKYGGKVIFRLKEDERGKQQFSMVLSAKMASKPVTVGYDDVGLITGPYCYVQYLDI